jgi:predicted GNAT family N-acyltransferase
MTALAANGTVGRFRADLLLSAAREGDVAIEATHRSGSRADCCAAEVVGRLRIVETEERFVPALAIGRVIVREPGRPLLIMRIAADQCHVAVARAERILDH